MPPPSLHRVKQRGPPGPVGHARRDRCQGSAQQPFWPREPSRGPVLVVRPKPVKRYGGGGQTSSSSRTRLRRIENPRASSAATPCWRPCARAMSIGNSDAGMTITGSPRCDTRTSPPYQAAVAVSACPSYDAAHRRSCSIGTLPPKQALSKSRPATIAAVLEPRPRLTGIWLDTIQCPGGLRAPVFAWYRAGAACQVRLRSSVGTWSRAPPAA